MGRQIFLWFSALFYLSSCVTAWLGIDGYDSRYLAVQTLDLFSQYQLEPVRGDWVFRRERLELIDSELRRSKPDILVLQSLVERRGSPTEADDRILGAGSLAGYDFEKNSYQNYDLSQEVESLGVAVSLPLKIERFRVEPSKRKWSIGITGYMAATLVRSEGQLLSVFNIKMPDAAEDQTNWRAFVPGAISQFLQEHSLCPRRVILAGKFPFRPGDTELFESIGLKDVVGDDCDLSRSCNTASIENELFRATFPGEEPGRLDRIFVSEDAYVNSFSRFFDASGEASEYVKSLGFQRLWPSVRFGWRAEVRFPKCDDDEFMATDS